MPPWISIEIFKRPKERVSTDTASNFLMSRASERIGNGFVPQHKTSREVECSRHVLHIRGAARYEDVPSLIPHHQTYGDPWRTLKGRGEVLRREVKRLGHRGLRIEDSARYPHGVGFGPSPPIIAAAINSWQLMFIEGAPFVP